MTVPTNFREIMKIISSNVQGLNDMGKLHTVLSKARKYDISLLQETKMPRRIDDILLTNNLIALLNLYEIIFVCIKSSLYEPCTDGGLKYNLSHLFHPQKNKFPFSCQ